VTLTIVTEIIAGLAARLIVDGDANKSAKELGGCLMLAR